MPDLLLELFSEEIPARMQVRGAEDLARLAGEALAALAPTDIRSYSGPRRIALAATVQAGVAESRVRERGPRVAAPEQALAGFLRKHAAAREDLRQEGEFWVLDRAVAGVDAASLIAREMPGLLRRFPWPKSMRWGGRVPPGSSSGLPVTSRFTWVRPLRRILCILDGVVVPFDLRDGEDDGHGLASGNLTEGHRFMAPGPFAVASEAEWRDGLRERRVVVDAAERRAMVWDGLVAAAAGRGLSVVEDAGLLDEVAGLVEWPVPLLGRIDAAFMDLPPEVMQVSMRVNQRYFALRDADGRAAPLFAFAANIEADDEGAAIVAGNERVLRARFSDARHFWDLDRQRTLESRVEDLKSVTFHAKIGTQYERAKRLRNLALTIAKGVPGQANLQDAPTAGWLCKADLLTGMVEEFPELQGTMGGYYAREEGLPSAVAEAIRDHYRPRGPSDPVPTAPASISVALADKLDQLVQFFAVGEKPTGSGDPFGLRRAALGVIRIVRENRLRLRILPLVNDSLEVRDFLFERLRIQLRAEGERHDILAAILRSDDDDILLALSRMASVAALVTSDEGINLLTLYRRDANILRAEEARDGTYDGRYDPGLLRLQAERELHDAFNLHNALIALAMAREMYGDAMQEMSLLRAPVDRFFNEVTVNDPDPELRRNRLGMLAALRGVMHQVADFSKIEG